MSGPRRRKFVGPLVSRAWHGQGASGWAPIARLAMRSGPMAGGAVGAATAGGRLTVGTAVEGAIADGPLSSL